MIDEVADPGVQNERTRLAWQRTLLAGLVCSLLVARLLVSQSWQLALLIGALASAVSAAMSIVVTWRYHANHHALHVRRSLADGRTPVLAALLVMLTGLGALATSCWSDPRPRAGRRDARQP